MGYIRDNEDYYMAEGYSPKEARIRAKMFELGVDDLDWGYCNPIKSKLAAEDEADIRERVEKELGYK